MSNVIGIPLDEGKEIYCHYTNGVNTVRANRVTDLLGCYVFTLILEGGAEIVQGGERLSLHAGDMMMYAPCISFSILSATDDYQSVVVLADESATLDAPIAHNMVLAAYMPLVALRKPLLKLSATDAAHIEQLMRTMIAYDQSEHAFRTEAIRTLYSLFLLDVLNIEQRDFEKANLTKRTSDLLVGFVQLARKHCIEHREVGFYADRLCITPTYLSRIVRQATGRTVLDHLGQLLMAEASYLLRTSDMPIAEIAERLRFADQASFSHFFCRHKGISPTAFRAQ